MRFLKSAHIILLLIINSFYVAGKPPVILSPEKEPVKIGLLIQDAHSQEARCAAELAIRQTNSNGGINGHPVQLVIRSMEGPWGTGSKQTVDLVFSENVWAIVGSHDGRNAHLAEQVITKTQTPFVSAWAADPTLTQAFVPWFFNIVPNNKQQAGMLAEEIYLQKKYKKVAVLNATIYDSKSAADWFLKEIKNNPVQPTQLIYDENNFSSGELIGKIKNCEFDCIVLFGTPKTSLRIIQSIREAKMNHPVYCDVSVLGEDDTKHFNPKDYEGVYLVNPGFLTNKPGEVFSKKFADAYGWNPGAVAAFTFDAINIILKAIKKSGSDTNQIKGFLQQSDLEGVTGPISFDKFGNRLGTKGFVLIKDGLIKPVEK